METLPEIKLTMEPLLSKDVIGFKYNSEFKSEHKLGGNPDFIQEAEWPICKCCHCEMTFYGQLDSVGDSMCLADCGRIYVFYCFDCNEVHSFVQSY